MSFQPELDLSVADWWLHSDDWAVASECGPEGYVAYVRFRHHLEGQQGPGVLWLLLDDLAVFTAKPDEVFVAQWDGVVVDSNVNWVDSDSGQTLRTKLHAHFLPDRVKQLPRATRGGDSYLLFRGPLSDLGRWPVRDDYPFDLDADGDFPEVVCGAMWPSDRAWFYAWDMSDEAGATLACGEDLAAVLLADGRYAAGRVGREDPNPRGF